MKLLLPYNKKDLSLSKTFEDAKNYVLYDSKYRYVSYDDRKIEDLDEFLTFLFNNGIDEIICNEIDPFTVAILNDYQIKVNSGNKGNVDELLDAYLR